MINLIELIQQVLLGQRGLSSTKEMIKNLNDSRTSCAYRLCRAFEEKSYHDIAGHLRQFLLTHKCGLILPAELATPLKRLTGDFQLYIDDNLEVKALAIYPQWLDNADRYLGKIYNYQLVRQHNIALGDGVLYHMTGYSHYISWEQKAIINASMCLPPGHTLLACLPTGGGKSLVGQMPAFFYTQGGTVSGAVDEAGSSIVVVPTVALAIDQAQAADRYFKNAISDEHRPAAYYSGINEQEKKRIYDGLKNGTLPLLFISPEATLSVSFQQVLLEAARRGRLNSLIIDEAHIVVDWGNSFRHEFQFLASFRRKLLRESAGRIKTILLSATLTDWTSAILRELFAEGDNLVEVRGDALRPEPMFWLDNCSSALEREEKILEVLPLLPRPIILYVTKPERAEDWCAKIKARGFNSVDTFTGNTSKNKREEILQRWGRNELDIIVATSAFGMGVDKPDIRTVIHCCLPESINRFYQEVGRGGRDGYPSISILSFVPSVDSDETFSLIKSSVLKAVNIAVRWESMRINHLGLEGDALWVDTDTKPPHLEDKITGKRNAEFNEFVLLFLSRKKYIDILDIKDERDVRRQVQVRMNKIEVLQNKELLLQEITPLRHTDWQYILQEYQAMMALARNKKTCWAGSFVKTYPHTVELCGSCPACRRRKLKLYNDWQPYQVWGEENLSVSANITGLLATWLGVGKEVFLYYPDAEPLSQTDLTSLISDLIKDGVAKIIMPEPTQRDWKQMLAQLPGENNYYSIYGWSEVLGEDAQPFISGPVALVYPSDVDGCLASYHWSQDYLKQRAGNQIIHIAAQKLTIEGKRLSEWVDGGYYAVKRLISSNETEYDWL